MQVQLRSWYCYLMDIVVFIAVLLLIEDAFRQPAIENRLGIPSIWGHVNRPMGNLLVYAEEQHDPPDIIIIGSSQSRTAINPVQLADYLEQMTGEHISIINNSANWATGEVSVRLMTELYAPFYIPDIILMAASTDMFPAHYQARDWQRVTEGTGTQLWFENEDYTPLIRWFLKNSRLWQYSNDIPRVLAGTFKPLHIDDTPRGFETIATANPDVARQASEIWFTDFWPPGRDRQALDKLVAWCEQHDVLLVLFTVPEHPNLIQQNPVNWQAFLEDMNALAANSAQVIFLDLTVEGRLDDSAYYDPVHVNATGAEQWTERLARFMLSAQVLQQAEVGIIRIYGDNFLSIFYLEDQQQLHFYAITPEFSGVMITRIRPDEWGHMKPEDSLSRENGAFKITLTRISDSQFKARLEENEEPLTESIFGVPD